MKTRDQVHLFYLAFDEPIDKLVCGEATCLFEPHTSWTAGRNRLARRIAQRETEISAPFRYWMFADHDMHVAQNCHRESTCRARFDAFSVQQTACCFDIAVGVLLAPETRYAAVNFLLEGASKVSPKHLSMAHQDCADGALTAFHRLAVPVVFPYVELVDRRSWHESQGIHFHLVSGCFPGYSVFSNVFEISRTLTHSRYPRGRRIADAARAMHRVYGTLGLIPVPLSRTHEGINQGNCVGWQDEKHGLESTYEPRNQSANSWRAGAWLGSGTFLQCHAALQPRWSAYVQSGNLTRTDGMPF